MRCGIRSGTDPMKARDALGAAHSPGVLRSTAWLTLRKRCSAAVADEQWTRGVAPTKVDGAAGQADEPNGAHWNFMMSGTVGRASGARRKHG